MLMAVLLLAGTVVHAQGETLPVTPPDKPVVVVEGNAVKDEPYFELSLYVTANNFQTVGTVLSYDRTVLQPVEWDLDATPIEVTDESWVKAIPAKGTDMLSGKPALVRADYKDGTLADRAYLYLGAEALQFVEELNNERVVTVRFAYVQGNSANDVTLPGSSGSAGPCTVELAPPEVASDAIPGSQVLVTTKGDDVELNTYRSVDTVSYSFLLTSKESIADSGEAPMPSGDYAITFFDWDGRVIDAITSPANGTEAVELWQKGETIQERLTNKDGYEFNKWLVVYQPNDGRDLQTINGSLTSVKASESSPANADQTPKPAAKIYVQDTFDGNGGDLEKINTAVLAENVNAEDGANNASAGSKTSVLLQASYKATEEVNGGSAANGGQGLGEDEDLGQSWTFYQYGTPTYYQYGPADAANGQYGITVPLKRGNVLRANLPAIQAQVYVNVNGQTKVVVVKVDVENTDDASFEVVVPKGATHVTLRLRDTYNASDWLNSQSRTGEIRINNADFVKGGALGAIIEESWQAANGGTWTSTINAQCFTDAGCPVGNVDQAKAALVAKVKTENRRLTESEVIAAVTGK